MRDSSSLAAGRSLERITLTNEVELECARLQCERPPDEAAPTRLDAPDLVPEMRLRFARADFSGALVIAETILSSGDGDDEAKSCADACRANLVEAYVASIGSLEQVPALVTPLAEIDARSVDHRAGFVLSQVDGATSLATILDVSGMSSLDALRIVRELVRLRVIVLHGGMDAKARKG
jgi:hypothetical protein